MLKRILSLVSNYDRNLVRTLSNVRGRESDLSSNTIVEEGTTNHVSSVDDGCHVRKVQESLPPDPWEGDWNDYWANINRPD